MSPRARLFIILVMSTVAGCGGNGSDDAPPLLPSGPAATFHISVSSTGAQGNSWSDGPSISSDGRRVAFESAADNLVAGDTNGEMDVFVRDLARASTILVSVNSEGAPGDGYSHEPSISADGRFVAFSSRAANLVPGDENNHEDIFVRDLLAGTTVRVSVDSAGVEADCYSGHPSISGDGRYVAFESVATNLVAGDTNRAADIFVRDLVAETTVRVSVGPGGRQGDNACSNPAISSDGRHVAFESSATTLVEGDSNESTDVFRHDRVTGTTERVSLGRSGAEGNLDSFSPALSADGRRVVFESLADNLVAGDTNQEADIFLRDLGEGTTLRVSVGVQDAESNGQSRSASISSDGRIAAFRSFASNLVAEDTNGWADVFVRDLEAGTTTRISVDSSGVQGNSGSHAPELAQGGRFVAFRSNSTTLSAGDTNGESDVFVRGPIR